MIGAPFKLAGGGFYWRAKTKRKVKKTLIILTVLLLLGGGTFFVLKQATQYSLEQAQRHLNLAYLCQRYYPKEYITSICMPELEQAASWARWAPIPFMLNITGFNKKN